jgi:opacity protein-like surface antigen
VVTDCFAPSTLLPGGFFAATECAAAAFALPGARAKGNQSMKLFLTTAAALILSAAVAQAQTAQSPFSVSVLGGWSSHPGLTLGNARPNLDDGFNVGARLGYDLRALPWPGFSVDADYFYNESDYQGAASGAKLGSSSYMADLTYHFPLGASWSGYGGAGLGAVTDNLSGNLHGASTVFGWQALGGMEYQFTPSMAMFAEYRYQNAHDANITGGPVGNTSNNLSVGVKFRF